LEIGEENAVIARSREPLVHAAGPRELREDLDHVPDIADHEKGRAPFCGREMPHIAAGLMAGPFESRIPLARAPLPVAGFAPCRRRGFCIGALLGFQDKRTPAIDVDESGRGFSVRTADRHCPLEHVPVGFGIRRGWVGPGKIEEIAQLGDEELVIRPFMRPRGRPARDEGIERGIGRAWRQCLYQTSGRRFKSNR